MYQNMKIEINMKQPLDEIVEGLERLGYSLAFETQLKGEIPNVVDHIDGNTLNNDIKNLRSVTASNNAMNCKTPVNNTSGQKGVYFHKSIGKYTASIRVDGKLTHLGTFIDFYSAKQARLEGEVKYYGDYANDR